MSELAITLQNMPKPPWVVELEVKHGLPIEQVPGTVYTICYDPPAVVHSVSTNYAGPDPALAKDGFKSATPIRHYVGWTQKADPKKRIAKHHRAGTARTVTLLTGSMLDERKLQQVGRCPTCGRRFSESLAN